MALLKLCRCGKKISIGEKYCNECNIKVEQSKRDSNKHYDKHIRNKRSTEFYHSKEWINLRVFVLDKYKGIDLYAYYIENEIKVADTVHHIEEIKDNWSRRLDISNLMPVSSSSHNTIDALYKRDKARTQKMLFGLLNRWREEMEG